VSTTSAHLRFADGEMLPSLTFSPIVRVIFPIPRPDAFSGHHLIAAYFLIAAAAVDWSRPVTVAIFATVCRFFGL
jgi:hypothetical protein